jgi:hypothetical protein
MPIREDNGAIQSVKEALVISSIQTFIKVKGFLLQLVEVGLVQRQGPVFLLVAVEHHLP